MNSRVKNGLILLFSFLYILGCTIAYYMHREVFYLLAIPGLTAGAIFTGYLFYNLDSDEKDLGTYLIFFALMAMILGFLGYVFYELAPT